MLTKQQSAALRAIIAHQRRHHGVSPTVREVAAGIGLKSPANALRVLRCLEERGCIVRLPKRAQAIQVLPMAHYLLRRAA